MTFFGLNLVLICYWAISTAGLLIWIATNKADLFENPKLDNPSPHDCPHEQEHLYYLVHLDKHSSLISRCIYSSNKTLWFWVKIEVPLFLAHLSHLHFGSNMKYPWLKNLYLASFDCPGLTIIYIPKNLVYPKGPLNSEFKGVGTIVQELSTLPLLCMFHQEQTCLLDNISLCIKWFNKLRIDSTNCVVWYIHTYKKLVLEHAPH